MADFGKAVEEVLKREGGLVDDPDDPGGLTRFGISSRWVERAGLNIDVRTLTRERAAAIYREYFWEPYRFKDWSSDVLASKMFDMTVNMGPAAATKVLQRALRACGRAGVVDDGAYGAITEHHRAEVAVFNEEGLHLAMKAEHAGYYRALVAEKPRLGKFLGGWLRRAYEE